MFAYISGSYVQEERATVSIYDRGFLLGDGLFETMRIYGGRYFRAKDHIHRLFAGLEYLGISIRLAPQDFERILHELVIKNVVHNGFARILVSRGKSDFGLRTDRFFLPTLAVIAKNSDFPPLAQYEEGFSAILSTVRAISPEVNRIKSLNYLPNILAMREAETSCADDALILDAEDHVLQGTASNVFAVVDGELVTPPDDMILAGVTRKVVLELAGKAGIKCAVRPLGREEVARKASEVFLTSSVMEVRGIVKLGDAPVGEGKVGPVTRQVSELYRKQVQEELGL